jgi:phenylacetate-CoA ligase
MRQLGHVSIFFKSLIFPLLSPKQQQRMQKKRIKKLVEYVKTNSPYFAELYKDIGENFNLSDLPVTTKEMMMENFNDWLTDPSIKLEEVNEFMKDKSNIGVEIKNKYIASETSGSTGYPATMLLDKTTQNVETVVSFLRAFIFRFPICCVFVDESFGISNGTTRQNAKRYPFLRKFIHVVNSKKPLEQIVQELNAIKPRLIVGYPGTLELLADEALEERLNIRPSLILLSGEYLKDATRTKISKAFRCRVRSIYGCTEGGTMAFECSHNHYHINSDWCIIEPVDGEYRPVPPGEMSSKVLLTNLANITQPIIRYEVTDRVIMHNETCPCGKRGLWLEVEGRTSDVIYFQSVEKKIGVAPMSLYDIIEVIPGVKNFQLILHSNNEIEFRLVCMKNADPEKTFECVKQTVIEYLKGLGISNVSMYLSDVPPQFHPKSGKFKQIYQASDEV